VGASPARFASPSKRKRARHLGRQVRFAPPRRKKLGTASQPAALGTPWERRFGQRRGGSSTSARRSWCRRPFEPSLGQQTGRFSNSVGRSWYRRPFEASFGQRTGGFSSSVGRSWHRRPSEASFGQQGGRSSSSARRSRYRRPFGASFGQRTGGFSSSVGRWWGAHADGSVSREPSWSFPGIPAPDWLITPRHPRSLYTCPPFFVHFVHFAVPIRARAILPDVLAQFREVFLKPCRSDRGSWAVRKPDGPALGRRALPDKTPTEEKGTSLILVSGISDNQ